LPLNQAILADITQLKIKQIQKRIEQQHHINLNIANTVVQHIVDQCQQQSIGARQIDNILTKTLLPNISELFLKGIISGKAITQIRVTLNSNGQLSYEANSEKKTTTRKLKK